MNDSQSSGNEDIIYRLNANSCMERHHKSLTKLTSKNRSTFLNSNRSSEPNCESDSEGILTSRAIGRLSLREHKRSFESDHGTTIVQNNPKKFTRRRRKPKSAISNSMQIDDGMPTLKNYREQRNLGKRKRWANAPNYNLFSKRFPIKMEISTENYSISDGESVESYISGKAAESYLSHEDTAADGDDEQSDWCQDFTGSNHNPQLLHHKTTSGNSSSSCTTTTSLIASTTATNNNNSKINNSHQHLNSKVYYLHSHGASYTSKFYRPIFRKTRDDFMMNSSSSASNLHTSINSNNNNCHYYYRPIRNHCLHKSSSSSFIPATAHICSIYPQYRFSSAFCRSRSIKTGNRRLMQNSNQKYGGNYCCYVHSNCRRSIYHNVVLTDQQKQQQQHQQQFNNSLDKPKRFSSKRLRCGSVSFKSTSSSNNTFTADSDNNTLDYRSIASPNNQLKVPVQSDSIGNSLVNSSVSAPKTPCSSVVNSSSPVAIGNTTTTITGSSNNKPHQNGRPPYKKALQKD